VGEKEPPVVEVVVSIADLKMGVWGVGVRPPMGCRLRVLAAGVRGL